MFQSGRLLVNASPLTGADSAKFIPAGKLPHILNEPLAPVRRSNHKKSGYRNYSAPLFILRTMLV